MIDTQAIRKKVLDLALRGKLTEQLLEDGTTELLLKELRLSKEKYERNAGNKKTNMSYVQDGKPPFEIPDSWMWVQMGEVFSHNTGKALNTSVQKGTLLDYITTSNVYWDRFELSSLKSMYFTDDEIEKCTIRKGDLLICEGGDIGRSSIWPFDTEMRIQNHIHRLRSYLPSIDVKLYYYVMRYYKMKGLISGRGIGLEGFSSKRLHNLTVPLMPTEEQHRIVVKIDAIFSLLDTIDTLQSQYQDNLATLKSKIIDAGIQGKLTEQLPEDGTAEELYQQIQQEKRKVLVARGGREDKSIKPIEEDVPYILPSTWKWIRFGDIGLFKKGPFGSALTKSMFVPKSDTTIKVYEQQHAINKKQNLGTYYITREYFDEKMRGFEVRPGDVIISCAGTIGETYILPDDIEQGIINQALMRVTIVPSIDKKFFQLFFDARLKRNAQSQSNGSAINNIPPFEVLKNWYFPLPPLAEQKRIVAKLEELLPMCEG